jgi:hypothetical protein
MRKHRWAIIGGVCILALLVVGAVFIPRIFGSGHAEERAEIVMPEHWWKTDLNEQQLKTLQASWGSEMPMKEFVFNLWPEVMQELPSEMVDTWERKGVYWPTEKFEDWERGPFQTMCFGLVVPEDGQTTQCFDVYLGTQAAEETTLRRSTDLGLVEDRCYRVSMYTDEVIESQTEYPALGKA